MVSEVGLRKPDVGYGAFEHLCWVAFPDGPAAQMMANAHSLPR
jgi:hypothetical protein